MINHVVGLNMITNTEDMGGNIFIFSNLIIE